MIQVSTYNCQSAKRNFGGIQKLCNESDVVIIQEHWLFPSELSCLNNIHNDFVSFGISSMNPSNDLIVGRPYGGVAVLWKNNLSPFVRPVTYDDDRIIGLEYSCCGVKLLLLGVYLPYDTRNNFDQYVYYLAKLKSIVDEFDSPYVCILGDFNADVAKASNFGKELERFCIDSNLLITDLMYLPPDSVTHVNNGHGTEGWLDHVICTNGFHSLLSEIGICHSVLSSDHFPIFAKIIVPVTSPSSTSMVDENSNDKWMVDWASLMGDDLRKYNDDLEKRLADIVVPCHILHCQNCSCSEHLSAITQYYDAVIHCVQFASRSTISKKITGRGRNCIPGWNEFVEERHALMVDIYSIWALVGKPKHGYIYDQLRLAKSRFKYALRFCFRNEKDLRAKSLADKLVRNPCDTVAFWKEVRKLNSSPPLAQCVGNISGENNIAGMWKTHFSGILNSVQNDSCKSSILERLGNYENDFESFSYRETVAAIQALSSGRSNGSDQLSAEHFKFAGPSCAVHLSLCLTMAVRHGFLPPALTKVLLSPIVKDKSGNISDKDNYRPIALASVASKILETLVLNRSKLSLDTGDHQFGFKSKRSTDMAIYAVKEITDYYIRNSSPVFVCFLDARKAFDRVNHWKLYEKLLNRGMDACLVRMLMNWYKSQQFYVRWGKCISEGFSVSNGVRQGGILSPYLFNVYTDELSSQLSKSKVGCHYLGCANHLYYADDMVLLSPTPYGLQKMLKICEMYANDHDILFNTKKSVCMAVIPMMFKKMVLPNFILCNNILAYVDSYKYLGFHLMNVHVRCDDSEVQYQYRQLCCRANSLIRKFSMCSYAVKRFLYNAYCSTISCVHLWHSFRSSVLKKFKVCFNNAARMFFGYERFCSVSGMFVSERIDNFDACYRKAVWGFVKRICDSDNTILNRLFHSDLAFTSKIRKAWNSALY